MNSKSKYGHCVINIKTSHDVTPTFISRVGTGTKQFEVGNRRETDFASLFLVVSCSEVHKTIDPSTVFGAILVGGQT